VTARGCLFILGATLTAWAGVAIVVIVVYNVLGRP
jgi:hypothetical protein